MKLTEKDFEIREGISEYYIFLCIEPNLNYYLHSDLVIRGTTLHKGNRLGWYKTRELAEETINKFLKKENRQVEEKGIVVEYERYMRDGKKMVRILSLKALSREHLPKAYLESKDEVVFSSKGFMNFPNEWLESKETLPQCFSFMYKSMELPFEEFREKMSYIAKAGHNLASIKQELIEKKEEMEKLRKAEKKQTQWSGIKKVRF